MSPLTGFRRSGFALEAGTAAAEIGIRHYLYDIRPGNSRQECTNRCSRGTGACSQLCGRICDRGTPLNACLYEYRKAKEAAERHWRAEGRARAAD